VEEADKLFSMAFAQVCALKEVQRLGPNSFVQTIRGSFVQQIEPAKDATRMEEVVKLFYQRLSCLIMTTNTTQQRSLIVQKPIDAKCLTLTFP
jgi:hypothetical protein